MPARGVKRRPLATAILLAQALLLATVGLAAAQCCPDYEPNNDQIGFGCNPGPIEEFHHADPPVPPRRVGARNEPLRYADLTVSTNGGHVVDGHGFNLEHTLWSCPAFRRVLGRDILTAFQPDIARVDSG